jgi:hypothetical protein
MSSTELTINDYKQILEYYNEKIPKSTRLIKLTAEKILSKKLCRCIKKLDKTNEGRAIGICTKTIVNSKGYKRGKFTCRGNSSIELNKSKKNITKRRK